MATKPSEADLGKTIDQLGQLRAQIGRAIVGQADSIDHLLTTLLAGGHCLLEGVPGLAKTLMVRSLARALDLDFKRIQFTPDLMPSDIVGTEVLEEDHGTGRRLFKFNEGPVFTNILLADEINRSPPKTQSALLEAMQEHEVSYGGETRPLPAPFFVLATQNPIEQAGTYPLPEAQLDRFLLHVRIDYPQPDEELQILRSTTGTEQPSIEPVMNADDVLRAQGFVRQVHLSDALLGWVGALVRATRPGTDGAAVTERVDTLVEWGAGPRAGQALILAAKSRAFLAGRLSVTQADIEPLVAPVLRHRVLMSFRGQAERVTPDDIAAEVLARVERPESPLRG